MKKNDWILIIGSGLYSFFFYNEVPGINFLIFTVLAILLLLLKNPTNLRRPAWIIAATGSIATAGCLMWYGTFLALLGNVFSLLILSAISIEARTSIFVSLFHGFYSMASAFVHMILDGMNRSEKRRTAEREQLAEGNPPTMPHLDKKRGRWALIIIPVVLLIVFFVLYRASNPVFAEVTADLFDFISVEWLIFTLVGVLVMYGFFYHKGIPELQKFDAETSGALAPKEKQTMFDRVMSIINENRSGIMLFAVLNLLLLSVNIVDINYLWIGAELPEGLNYSEMVHQGVDALITSIIIAILIILYYFRGRLNFFEGTGLVKWLAIFWVAQNVLMIVSTAYRNHLYIDNHALTEKRIGVYVWLLLTVIGLTFTLVKIIRKRSNWYLVRSTGWSFYAVLVISCFFNWSVIITDYNLDWTERTGKTLDVNYLNRLSAGNLPRLAHWCESHKSHPEYEQVKRDLFYRADDFAVRWEEHSWKSWSKTGEYTYSQIKPLLEGDFFSDIDLPEYRTARYAQR